jgi:hypothetical protein
MFRPHAVHPQEGELIRSPKRLPLGASPLARRPRGSQSRTLTG